MTMKESAIQSKIMKWLNAQPETKAIKLHIGQYMPSGTPDILCVHQGKALFFEVKQPGESATKIQQLTHNEWRTAGSLVFVVTSLAEVQAVFNGV